MTNRQIVEMLIEQLTDEGFVQDEEERSYTLIDFRGTHRITTYWIEGLWVTFTETVEDDNGPYYTIPFEELLKENGDANPNSNNGTSDV